MASCGPLHTCELCGQEGMPEHELRSHMRIEHVEGSPACPFCDLAELSHAEMVREVWRMVIILELDGGFMDRWTDDGAQLAHDV